MFIDMSWHLYVTGSQTETDLNHFQSLKGASISKCRPVKFPRKMFCSSLFLRGLKVTVSILQLASIPCFIFNLFKVQY